MLPLPSCQTPFAKQFNSLLAKGDYAAALALIQQSTLPPSEKDALTGTLILEGLVNKAATTRPPYPLAEGFNRLEKAAAAGRDQTIADLRAKFTTGINGKGENVLMPPNPPLAECWTHVEEGKAKPDSCISMRQRLHIP